MSKGKRRTYSREFKVSAVERLLAGESTAAVSRELRVSSSHLYKWCMHYRRGGPGALRGAHRPRKVTGLVEFDPAVKAQPVSDLAAARKRIVALDSSSWNWIFFNKPCGKSGKHASRATGLACRRLRAHRGAGVPAARRADSRANVCVGAGEPHRLLPSMGGICAARGRDGVA